MRVIGLMGSAGAGKDTVAGFLVRNHGFERIAFADPLKELALELDPEIKRDLVGDTITLQEHLSHIVERMGWDRAKSIPAVREYLQRLGVAAREKIHEDVWVDAAFAKMDHRKDRRYVITDVRFPNEIEFVCGDVRGEVWLVDRESVNPPNNHISETAWRNVIPDVVVPNNGTFQELEDTVTRILLDS